ncbi:alpha/beta hydrolase [Actinosynnema sp. ALI-1.44]|uniref:alpha/beta hydrolase n=1 Tax=Actinosynnema sp. ALI-1.44 TaxID=1933779 RepID=UPI00143D112E|nr:alpha/beta hydrolase [Actinosynnema sp. ALI-1.44]
MPFTTLLGERMRLRGQVSTVVFTVAVACALVVPSSAQAATLEWGECRQPATAGVQCARLRVPVDWATGRGGFELALARRQAPAGQRIGTVVYLPGGPGDSGVDQLRGGTKVSPAVAARFDVVTLDPRGTTGSSPVRCDPALVSAPPNVNPDTGGRLTQVVEYSRKLAASCRAGTGDVLDHIDSSDVARDVEAVRAAIGARQVSLYSRSYGTLVAQTYARMYPHRVRAMVLDSVFDHSLSGVKFLETTTRGVEDSFNAFAAWCVGATECALHSHDVGAVFDGLYLRAERGDLTEPSDPDRRISPTDLSWQTMRGWLYRPDWPGLADRLARLARFLPAGTAPPQLPATASFPMAAFCADHRFTFRDEHDWQRQWAKLKTVAPHMRTHLVWQVASICSGWPLPVTNPQAEPRVWVPALLLNNRYDPATPWAGAAHVNRTIPRSVLLTRESGGHGVYVSARNACADQATDRYFVDLELPAPGTSCH